MKYNIYRNPFVHSRLLRVLARMPYSDFIRKLHDRGKLFWHGNAAGYTYPDINKTTSMGGGSIHFGTRGAALERALHLKYGIDKPTIQNILLRNYDPNSSDYNYNTPGSMEAADKLYPSYHFDKIPPNTHYIPHKQTNFGGSKNIRHDLKPEIPIKITPYIIRDPGRKGFVNFEKYNNSKNFQDGEGYLVDDPDSAANKYLSKNKIFYSKFKKVTPKNMRKVVIYPNQQEDEGSRSIAITDPDYAMPYRDIVKKFGDTRRSMKTGKKTKAGQYADQISNYHKYKFESTFYSKLEKIILESLSSLK